MSTAATVVNSVAIVVQLVVIVWQARTIRRLALGREDDSNKLASYRREVGALRDHVDQLHAKRGSR